MADLEVPVVDFACDEVAIRSQIHSACRRWGFFQVRGHAIEPTLSASMLSAAQRFFAQPSVQKNSIRRSSENPWGFYDSELTKNVKDWKEIVDIGPERGAQQPQWPEEPSEFREIMEVYSREAQAVARTLTRILLANLAEPAVTELDGFSNDSSFLRLNYYPVCANPAPADLALDEPASQRAGHLGISHHTDAGAVTVLQQFGPPGLQVMRDGRWHTVDVLEDALVINIGDVAQVWSNDVYPAPLHRVLANSQTERFSAAYFFNPDFDYSYAPLVADAAPAYRAINWGEFRAGRAAGDYADEGEEIQIDHYRL